MFDSAARRSASGLQPHIAGRAGEFVVGDERGDRRVNQSDRERGELQRIFRAVLEERDGALVVRRGGVFVDVIVQFGAVGQHAEQPDRERAPRGDSASEAERAQGGREADGHAGE